MAMPLHYPGSLMTLDEWAALPEDNSYRYELHEGVLLVSPTRPSPSTRCPAEHPPIVRVPDVVVTHIGGPENRLVAADILLAVEIVSPGSRNVDLHLKPFEYAEAEIPHYWLVDLDPPAPSITVFHLGAPG